MLKISGIDIAIILVYFLTVILVGLWVSRRGAKNLESYFLGGKSLPWYILGVSDASGMFDISGTMVLVTWLFMYGLKSIWLPWVWPTFNQIFLMMFLSGWLRRSNVLTGAEWIKTRFGQDRGATLAHISVVFFALVAVVGMLAYAFKGIGKFAVEMLPWRFTNTSEGIFSDANIYARDPYGADRPLHRQGGNDQRRHHRGHAVLDSDRHRPSSSGESPSTRSVRPRSSI